MSKSGLALSAYQFMNEFKTVLQDRVCELNQLNDGQLQDGFNPQFIDDGWVSLKGFSWGFVMLYDQPVRMDTTLGPDWPFVGYRTIFIADLKDGVLAFVNQENQRQLFRSALQLADYGLRQLACKVGDGWLFDSYVVDIALANHVHGQGDHARFSR